MTADPARTAGAAGTTDHPCGTGRAGPPPSAITDQSRRPAGTTVLSRRPGSAVSAVAPQDPARPSGLAGPWGPIGAVADQRAPQQRIGGSIDHAQDGLLEGLQRR